MTYSTDIKTAMQNLKTFIETITNFGTLFPGGLGRGDTLEFTSFPTIFMTLADDSPEPASPESTIHRQNVNLYIVHSTDIGTANAATVEDSQIDRVGDIVDKIESDRTINGKARNTEILEIAYNEDERAAFPHVRITIQLEFERLPG